MPRDKSLSHEKIIQAAMAEFTEYGYDKASMRRIGDRCGLTAAALYRHFDSKEDMFDALVGPAVEDLNKWLAEHEINSETAISCCVHDDRADVSDGESASCCVQDDHGDAITERLWKSTEVDMMRELIYPRMPEYEMLVNKSRGSKYENFLNDLVLEVQARMWPFLKELRDIGYDVKSISENELHMLITAYCAALFEPVAHEYTLEEAVHYLETIESFFMPGWKNLLGFTSGS